MGNCYSAGGQTAGGSGPSSHSNPADGANDAVDYFLTSRGYRGLFSRIEVRHPFNCSSLTLIVFRKLAGMHMYRYELMYVCMYVFML